jgi:multidrug efflux pump subunit AcrA (membrane-fusion protein)
MKTAPVEASVRPQSLAESNVFEGAGQLLSPAQAQASVALPFTASVIELRVDRGQHVREGEILARVVIPEAARAAAQLEGQRLRQEADRERLQHLERLRSEGLARAGDVFELRARLRESEAISLEARALLATIEATGLRRRGPTYEVTAPLSGVIVERHAAPGGAHGPSDGPLLVVSGGVATRVEARFAFTPPEGVSYRAIAPDGTSVGVRLSAKAPQLSAADATLRCWFELEKPLDVATGTLVRVQLVPSPDLWIVPRSALAPELRLAGGVVVAAQVLATLGDQALVRAQFPADARVRIAPRAATP